MNATSAEIFLPEAQFPRYREALQQYLMADPPQLSERDFRRATAYRNSYYRAYRQTTLHGFPDKNMQFELLTPSPSHKVSGHYTDNRDAFRSFPRRSSREYPGSTSLLSGSGECSGEWCWGFRGSCCSSARPARGPSP
jgi:hypothetical protein